MEKNTSIAISLDNGVDHHLLYVGVLEKCNICAFLAVHCHCLIQFTYWHRMKLWMMINYMCLQVVVSFTLWVQSCRKDYPFPMFLHLPTPFRSGMHTHLKPFLNLPMLFSWWCFHTCILPKVKEVRHDVMTYEETRDFAIGRD